MRNTRKTKRSSKRSAYAQQLARSRQRPVAPARLVFDSWEDPKDFAEALALHMRRQASYAIQDTPDIVAKHYGRFLPENKASLAAAILNRVWLEG